MKNRILMFVLMLVVAFALAACGGDVKKETVTVENKEKIIEKVQQSKKLTDEEIQLFTLGLGHMQQAGDNSWVGKTVAQIIDDQRAKQAADAKAKADKAMMNSMTSVQGDAIALGNLTGTSGSMNQPLIPQKPKK